MSYTLLNKFLIFIAFASLMHTAYSAVQRKLNRKFKAIGFSINFFCSVLDRIYLRVTDQTNTTAHLPMDVSTINIGVAQPA